MRVVFIGCVQFSYKILEHLLKSKRVEVVGVTSRDQSPFNSDFQSLRPLAESKKIPYYVSNPKNQDMDQGEMEHWMRDLKPDLVFCLGWSFLLKKNILEIPPQGVIGYHPAELPLNRGRHPIIWALALGLKKTASTFFMMEEGVDSGEILNQKTVEIEDEDDARSLYDKLLNVAFEQVDHLMDDFVEKKVTKKRQDMSQATHWRKRTKEDGKIDWRMSAQSIYNLVRALTHPYVGAHFQNGENETKIWKTRTIELKSNDLAINFEPGKVMNVNGSDITVKCGENAILLLEHEFKALPEKGNYL